MNSADMISTSKLNIDTLANDLQLLLEEAIAFDGAQKGLLQFFDSRNGILKPVAQFGFDNEFLSLFSEVRAFDPTACGRALGVKGNIVIDNVFEDIAFIPFNNVITKAGFKSVKSIPLFNADRKVVGVISTRFTESQYHINKKQEIPFHHLQRIILKLEDLLLLKIS